MADSRAVAQNPLLCFPVLPQRSAPRASVRHIPASPSRNAGKRLSVGGLPAGQQTRAELSAACGVVFSARDRGKTHGHQRAIGRQTGLMLWFGALLFCGLAVKYPMNRYISAEVVEEFNEN